MTLKEALQQAIDSRSYFTIYAEVSPDGGCFMLDSEASFANRKECNSLQPHSIFVRAWIISSYRLEQILDEVNADEFPLG
jgi:hypothetical protein